MHRFHRQRFITCFLFFRGLIVFLFAFPAAAQTPHGDSLVRQLENLPQNEQRLQVLAELSNPDKRHAAVAMRIEYALQGLALAGKLKMPGLQEDFLFAAGIGYYQMHDYPRSIEMAFRGLELSASIADYEYQTTFLYGMAVCYAEAGDLHSAIRYAHENIALLKKTGAHAKSGNQETIASSYNNIGNYFLQLGQLDSALIYMQESYRLGMAVQYDEVGLAVLGLGMIEDRMGHTDLAFSYYRLAISQLRANNMISIIDAHQHIAKLFKKTNQADSAFDHAKQAYLLSLPLKDHRAIHETAGLLAELYEPVNELESLRYYRIAAVHKDSLNSAEKAKDFQVITAREQQRQLELQKEAEKQHAIYSRNLRYAAVAVTIITFFILFFVFSRTFIVTEKLISFFAMLGLLAVFEFINLLIHPSLEILTHHSVVLMLLILMGIGALLIPLHHKMEHWVKHKLIEKNKALRLAAERKRVKQVTGS